MSFRSMLYSAIFTLALIDPASIVEAQPAKGFNDLGVMAFEAKHYDLAIEHFEKALSLAPDNPSIRTNLCAVHQAVANDLANAGKMDEAIERVQRAIKADPENASPLAQLGAYFMKEGKLSEAIENLESAVVLNPDSVEARILLGEGYYQQNKLADASKQWVKALELNPDLPGLQEKLDKLSRESDVEQDFNHYTDGHFEISYAKVLSEDTRAAVFAVLEEAYTGIGEKLGGVFPPSPVQVVLYDGEQFTEATLSPGHVGALYDGKIRAPLTGRNGRFLDRRVLSLRLTHEYVHVALVNHVGQFLPWWLNEGLAEVFSREMDVSRKRMLRRAFAGERDFSLSELEGRQLDKLDKNALAIAYAQAHAVADLLWQNGGTEKLAAFLSALKSGSKPEAALKSAYGLDYAALEREVKTAYQ